MSDHIDDSTTDEEIMATVMRDKIRASNTLPNDKSGNSASLEKPEPPKIK